jgi:uncharacterized protein YraI
MKRIEVLIGIAALAGAGLAASPAAALMAYATAHLNLRSGPGFQYPVVGQVQYKSPAEVTGCILDFSWCSVNVGGVSAWASAQYLTTNVDGVIETINTTGAVLGIPVVVAPDTGAAVVATPPVGVVTPVAPAVGLVAPIEPAPAWVSYVTGQAVEPVYVTGETVVGAVLPAAVPFYAVPESPYAYAAINGQRVLVEPAARRIVYVFP